jgi:HSP20 family protein
VILATDIITQLRFFPLSFHALPRLLYLNHHEAFPASSFLTLDILITQPSSYKPFSTSTTTFLNQTPDTHSITRAMSFSRGPSNINALIDILANGGEVPASYLNKPTARSNSVQHATSRRAFSPNFDVLETQHEYILEGEVPGLADKKALNIEFTDDKTLLVRGHIERASIENKPASHKPTVEDAPDDDDKDAVVVKTNKKGVDNRPKYWVQERTIGDFERSFSFPSDVDVDSVKATLEFGILKIVVPKMERKVKGRKIEIQ